MTRFLKWDVPAAGPKNMRRTLGQSGMGCAVVCLLIYEHLSKLVAGPKALNSNRMMIVFSFSKVNLDVLLMMLLVC